ncbi:hypothetical protein BDW66DRAFT_104267 [Aspergillus desertorum]
MLYYTRGKRDSLYDEVKSRSRWNAGGKRKEERSKDVWPGWQIDRCRQLQLLRFQTKWAEPRTGMKILDDSRELGNPSGRRSVIRRRAEAVGATAFARSRPSNRRRAVAIRLGGCRKMRGSGRTKGESKGKGKLLKEKRKQKYGKQEGVEIE